MDEYEKWLKEQANKCYECYANDRDAPLARFYEGESEALDRAHLMYRSMTCKMEKLNYYGTLINKCSVCEHNTAVKDEPARYCEYCGRRVING